MPGVLEPIFEADFTDCSFGFRPGKNAHQAIDTIRQHLTDGFREVYDADLKGYFDTIPKELEECARIDGATRIQAMVWIILPLAVPGILSAGIFAFTLSWNEFLYAVVLITDEAKRTLPLGIQRFMGDHLDDTGMLATGLMIAVIPIILAYVFFSEKMIQGMTAGAIK